MKINHVYYFPKQDVIFYVVYVEYGFGCCEWLTEYGFQWSSWKHKLFFKHCIDLGEL